MTSITSNADSRLTGFVIGNTADLFEDKEFYATPLRMTSELVYAGVIVKNVDTAKKVAEMVDGLVDCIFVDAEKKIRKIYYGSDDIGNIERAVRERVIRSKILTYKGNDLAADAVDLLLGQLIVDLGGSHIAIIGLGNLGAKVALKLVERGAHVHVQRRNKEKLSLIVQGLNHVKSEHIVSEIVLHDTIEEACHGVDIIIACTNEKSVITTDMVATMNSRGPQILIDAGKGCFHDEVVKKFDYNIFRIDVSIVQQSFFDAILKTRRTFAKPKGHLKLTDFGVVLVSMGLLAGYGDFVVDDINTPTMILGVADGKGSFLQRPHPFEEKLAALEAYLSKNV